MLDVYTLEADDNKTGQKYAFRYVYSNIPKLNFIDQGQKSMRRGPKKVSIQVCDNTGVKMNEMETEKSLRFKIEREKKEKCM